MKRDLAKLSDVEEQISTGTCTLQSNPKAERLSRPTSSGERAYDDTCIFCDSKSKYMKGSSTREKLQKSSELRSDARVREAAEQKLDTKILAITSR